MSMNSSTVAAAQTALASQYNNARKDILYQAGDFATTTGAANAYVLALDAQVSALAAGLVIKFKASFTNTGAATINVNTLGARSLTIGGATLQPGDIQSGNYYIAIYDSTTTTFQIINGNPDRIATAYTAGEDLAAGDVVSITSNNTVARSTINGWSANGSDTNNGNANNVGSPNRWRSFALSSTIKVYIFATGINNGIQLSKVTVDPDAMTITSISTVTVVANSGGGNPLGVDNTNWDAIALDSDSILVVYNNGATARAVIMGTVASGTPTAGTVVDVQVGSAANIQCDVFDSTNDLLVVFRDTVANHFKLKQYTRSGSTLTAGTTSDFFTASATSELRNFRRFAGTTKFLVSYQDDTNTAGKVFAVDYDTGTNTFTTVGSTVSLPSSAQFNNGTNSMVDGISSSDGTIMYLAYQRTTNAFNAVPIVLSGATTLTFQTVTTGIGGYSGSSFSWSRIDEDVYAIGYSSGSNSSSFTLLQTDRDLTELVSIASHTESETNGTGYVYLEYANPLKMFTVRTNNPTGIQGFKANYTTFTHTYDELAGVVTADADSTAPVSVVGKGIAGGFSGLTGGDSYYTDLAGKVTDSSSGYALSAVAKVGVAKNATDMNVRP